MDCLPAGVSALADQDLGLLALKGTWGNVHHWALCSQGVGREAQALNFPPSKARCLNCKMLQMPGHLAETLGLHTAGLLAACHYCCGGTMQIGL